MFRKALVIGGGLIAAFILVNNATGSGTVIKDSTSGAVNVITALQGR
jgi:hypothetical protein